MTNPTTPAQIPSQGSGEKDDGSAAVAAPMSLLRALCLAKTAKGSDELSAALRVLADAYTDRSEGVAPPMPVQRATVQYGDEVVRVVIVCEAIRDHVAYVALGLERDIASQGKTPEAALASLRVVAELDAQTSKELDIQISAGPPESFALYDALAESGSTTSIGGGAESAVANPLPPAQRDVPGANNSSSDSPPGQAWWIEGGEGDVLPLLRLRLEACQSYEGRDELKTAVAEIVKLRATLPLGREECARVADANAEQCDKLVEYYKQSPTEAAAELREQARAAGNAHRATAAAIRSLSSGKK